MNSNSQTTIKQAHIYLAEIYASENTLERHQPVLIIQNNTLNEYLDTFITIPIIKQPTAPLSVYEIPIQEPFMSGKYIAVPFLATSIKKQHVITELGKINPTTFRRIQATLSQISH